MAAQKEQQHQHQQQQGQTSTNPGNIRTITSAGIAVGVSGSTSNGTSRVVPADYHLMHIATPLHSGDSVGSEQTAVTTVTASPAATSLDLDSDNVYNKIHLLKDQTAEQHAQQSYQSPVQTHCHAPYPHQILSHHQHQQQRPVTSPAILTGTSHHPLQSQHHLQHHQPNQHHQHHHSQHHQHQVWSTRHYGSPTYYNGSLNTSAVAIGGQDMEANANENAAVTSAAAAAAAAAAAVAAASALGIQTISPGAAIINSNNSEDIRPKTGKISIYNILFSFFRFSII